MTIEQEFWIRGGSRSGREWNVAELAGALHDEVGAPTLPIFLDGSLIEARLSWSVGSGRRRRADYGIYTDQGPPGLPLLTYRYFLSGRADDQRADVRFQLVAVHANSGGHDQRALDAAFDSALEAAPDSSSSNGP